MAKSKPTLICRELDGLTIGQRRKDGYVNATSLSKAYEFRSGKRRDVYDWLRQKRTKETIEHLSVVTGIAGTELVHTIQGGVPEEQGTWIHPKLAVRFAIWLDDDFGLQVEDWVSDWMMKGREIPREEILAYMFPEEQGIYVKRFPKEFRDRLELVMKFKWESKATMAFISRTIYKPLMADDARERMNQINPQGQDGRRSRKIVQHTAPEFDQKVQERIKVVQVLLNVSRGRQSFWTNYSAQFGEDVQCGFDLAQLL